MIVSRAILAFAAGFVALSTVASIGAIIVYAVPG